MKTEGRLSQYFAKVAAKRLSAVEADLSVSHQHEFNGSKELKSVLGTGTGERIQLPAVFIRLADDVEPVSAEGFVTWYDARIDHPTRSEYRLYFPTTEVSELFRPDDLMIIARRTDGSIMIIDCPAGSTIESQLLWLFGIPAQTGFSFSLTEIQAAKDKQLDFAVRFILEELGVEIEDDKSEDWDRLLAKYQGRFPSTREFSILTRSTFKDVDPVAHPDDALMAWMNHEENLFRRLEKIEVEQRLNKGFTIGKEADVEGFLKFSLSIQNRRKARAGLALENHLEEIFRLNKIRFDRGAETENKVRPDFLFPGGRLYHDKKFSADLLTMLGVKTTCKDRWRQVLSEAARIPQKHLFTLEPGISENQTNEMQSNHLQLVVPTTLAATYNQAQQQWLMNVKDFILLLQDRQRP